MLLGLVGCCSVLLVAVVRWCVLVVPDVCWLVLLCGVCRRVSCVGVVCCCVLLLWLVCVVV